jgi:hypothetical protein
VLQRALARACAPDPASSSQDIGEGDDERTSIHVFLAGRRPVAYAPNQHRGGAGARLGRARCPRQPPAHLRLKELDLLDGGELNLLAGGGLRSLLTGFPAPPQSGPEVLTSTASHPC